MKINTNFNFDSGNWIVDWPERVAKHNLVYKTPPSDPMEGLALGNGEIGALVWFQDSKIIIVLNKSDLWDDYPQENFKNWSAAQEDKSTTLRHGCRIVVDFGLPIFETIYLNDFNALLDISNGSINIKTETPFGSVEFSAFVGYEDNTLVCCLEPNFKDNIDYEISIQRFGSRTFSHWYYLINRDASIGLGGTKSFVDEEIIGITHKLTDGDFAAGILLKNSKETQIPNNHITKSIFNNKQGNIEFIASITSPSDGDCRDQLKKILVAASSRNYDELFEQSSIRWQKFWEKSFVYTSDEYIDNLWHLNMYYMRCCQGGKYPGRFVSGLWAWYHDSQPWNFYFHWNQQCLNWPLNAAGFSDLLDSYFDWRFNALELARRDAQTLCNKNGAFVSDVTDGKGRNSTGEIHNYTPVAQIAIEFFQQYQYTGDKEFLSNKAIPYLYEACLLFIDLFEVDNDGIYRPVETCGFEGWIKLKDSIATISCGIALFKAAAEAFDEAGVHLELRDKVREIAEKICPIPLFSGMGDLIISEDDKLLLNRGMFKGDVAFGEHVLAAGYRPEDGRKMSSIVPSKKTDINEDFNLVGTLYKIVRADGSVKYEKRDMANFSGIHTASENAAVFPSGCIGLKDKDSEFFAAAVNTAKLYSPEMLGWDCLPIMMARLGLTKQMFHLLQGWPEKWIFNSNGFSYYGPLPTMLGEFFFKNRRVKVEDAAKSRIDNYSDVGNIERQEVFEWQTWNFRHSGFEALAIVACGVNESLLQSYDGIIRVFPGNDSHSSGFTLHAQGGFVVSSQKTISQKPQWIHLHSKFGNNVNIANSWNQMYVYCNGKKITESNDAIVNFATQADKSYILVGDSLENVEIISECMPYKSNIQCKIHKNGNVSLGKPRLF